MISRFPCSHIISFRLRVVFLSAPCVFWRGDRNLYHYFFLNNTQLPKYWRRPYSLKVIYILNMWHLIVVFPDNVINKKLCCQEWCYTDRMCVSEVVEEAVLQGCVDTCNSASIHGFLSGSWCVYWFIWAYDLDIEPGLLCTSCLSVCFSNQF